MTSCCVHFKLNKTQQFSQPLKIIHSFLISKSTLTFLELRCDSSKWLQSCCSWHPHPPTQIPLGDMCVGEGGGACKMLRRTNFPCVGMWQLVSGSLTFNSWCVWLARIAGAVTLPKGSAEFSLIWRSDDNTAVIQQQSHFLVQLCFCSFVFFSYFIWYWNESAVFLMKKC